MSEAVEIPGRRPAVQRRSQVTASRVLDAVLEILTESGSQNLTIVAVSERSGVSNGAIYHRFADRRQLLVEAHARFLARLSESSEYRLAPWYSSSDRQLFVAGFVAMFLDAIAANRALLFVFVSLGRDDPDMRAAGVAWSHSFARDFDRVLTERFGCSAAAADTAFRIVYSYAFLPAVFGNDEITSVAMDSTVRAEHLTTAVEAVLERH
ncbi:TetR/AcrR family transcriptional regulator [Mycolicibacterium alvei]|uniref:TetR/AcrR family transcriptional regulator n=1 Tax=Mycolicibacterium alvei TaxID=67081 RepID=UPI0013D57B14|nr:TetR/AcrR family transcriptional regulator [Mycolicibacterium alvei]MCV6999038.1 TetR/AcrR family transcriptional regulator [Mycolicibacterium alvei]